MALTEHESVQELDDEIAHVRDQIQELTRRRHLITNTLLSSTKVQSQLNNHNANTSINLAADLPIDENPLSTCNPSSTAATDHQTNMHRLSFTVTTFPFTDPSPQNTHLNGRLLGLRFDHCSRLGSFQKPYYILLRRVEKGSDEWRVHRHTIPAFVPLGEYEEDLLPVRDGGREDGDENVPGFDADTNVNRGKRKQDLHGFVRKVRHELVCWELRRSAIEFLKAELGLIPSPDEEDNENDGEDTEMTNDDSEGKPKGSYGILSIEATSLEARQARITWTDGTIGRVKISDRGLVERAVVVGEVGRIKGVENLLVDGESRIEDLVGKLRLLVREAA